MIKNIDRKLLKNSLFLLKIVTTAETFVISPPRPHATIYAAAPQTGAIKVYHADHVESESVNHDLSMVNVKSVLTLNRGEIKELNLIAQEAQRLQIPSHDYDHAMIILTPEQTSYPHGIDPQPLILASANIGHLHDPTTEHVTGRIEREIQHQRTQLVTPIAQHMAKVEQDIPILDNVSTKGPQKLPRNKVNELPADSGIVSLSASQASEQPVILNASRVNRLEHSDEYYLENLHEDNYYRRRIRALDLLRHVETDPNSNIQPVHDNHIEIFENTTNISLLTPRTQQTRIIDSDQIDQIQTLQRTDQPAIFDSLDRQLIDRVPDKRYLTSLHVETDNQTVNRAKENPVTWGKMFSDGRYQSIQSRLLDTTYEGLKDMTQDRRNQIQNLQPMEELPQHLETPRHPKRDIIYNYGKHTNILLVFYSLSHT